MIVLSYGGGTNSTAMLVGLHERGERPDLILFADTGGEKPHTYEHLKVVSEWCVAHGMPAIEVVRYAKADGTVITLEEQCDITKSLPSIAYGYKACSLKWKRDPQDKFVAQLPEAKELWKRDEKVTKLIGYDADEERRAKILDDSRYVYRYPLIEWKWGRKECVEAIARAGLPQPGKSACFFCPSSKPSEIVALSKQYPDLMERALRMEASAQLTTVKGLGRDYKWADLLAWNKAQLDMFDSEWSTAEVICECFDGCN